MIVNLLHAGHVLCGHHGVLPRTLLGDDATEVNDAVANDNVEAERAPIVVLDRGNDAAANVVVVGGWIRDVSGEARNGLQQIGARDDPGEFAVLHDRQALDAVGLHRIDDLFQRRVFGNADRIAGHDVRNLAAMLMNVIGRGRAGAQQESEPASALALRTDFATADEIALRDDPYQSAGRIDYW